MFAKFKRVLGNVTVEVKNAIVRVEGIPADVMARDIKKIWGTGRIEQNLFNEIDDNSFSFYEFFAVDVVYAIDRMIAHPQARTAIRTLTKIKETIVAGTWLAGNDLQHAPLLNREKLALFTMQPLPFQAAYFDAYEKNKLRNRLRGMLLAGAAGSGKAQPLDSLIRVPGGWKKMGEMAIGSEVIAKDGTVSKVVGVYPQGKKDIYRVTFADGRTAECCADHLWKAYVPRRRDYQHSAIYTTTELISLLDEGNGRRIRVDLVEPEKQEDIELPIDPYLLGVLLGDGCFRSLTPSITNPDREIFDEIEKVLPHGIKLVQRAGDRCLTYGLVRKEGSPVSEIVSFLKAANLAGFYSYEKHIPDVFLNASHAQRMALIQGLMDTDGTSCTAGGVSFCTTSQALANGFVYLIRSVGGIARTSNKQPVYTYSGERKQGRPAFIINIRHPDPSSLFRLERKRSRVMGKNQYSDNLKLRIEKIEKVREAEAQCIAIDHPEHLYVTDNFVVTHNTYTSIAQVEMLECDKVIVVVPNNSINRVWEANLLGNFINPPSYWLSNGTVPFTGEEKYLVVTYEYLAKLLALLGKFKYRKLTILLDESHNFNEIKSLRTELFLTLCEKTQPSDVIWLSGTPIKALATEAIPLIRCIDPTFTPECEARFRKIFGVSSERASDMLKNRLDGLMFKIEKHELKLLPPIFREVKVVVPGSERYTLEAIRERMQAYMDERYTYYNSRRKEDEAFFYGCLKKHEDGLRTPKDKDAFREYMRCLKVTILSQGDVRFAKDEIIYCNKYETRVLMPSLPAGERKAFKDIKSIVKYVKLKVQGECLGRVVGRARIEAHMAMAPCIDYVTLIESTEKKTLVYTSFTEVINVLERMLPEMGLEPLFVYGKTNSQLAGIIKKFDEDENANPLVATYASLSTAVPLVMADVMLMIDAPWRDYQLQQTVSRINRLGSDTQCYVYTAVLDTGEKPNISTRSFDILKWSQQQVVALTGVQSPFEIGDELEKADLALEEYELSTGQLPQPAFLEW